jgi:energy-converting hydrogenase Eha subunit F
MSRAMSVAEIVIMAAVICVSLAVMVLLVFYAEHRSDKKRLHSSGQRPQPGERQPAAPAPRPLAMPYTRTPLRLHAYATQAGYHKRTMRRGARHVKA